MSYILIVTIISSFGSADVQRVGGFASYRECATHAVAWADSQRSRTPIQNFAGIASAATNSGRSILPQQLRQLGNIRGNPPRLSAMAQCCSALCSSKE